MSQRAAVLVAMFPDAEERQRALYLVPELAAWLLAGMSESSE